MILVLACGLVEAQNLARACMPLLTRMLPPALILMPAWILVLPMILVLACELALACMPLINLYQFRGSRAGRNYGIGVDNQRVPGLPRTPKLCFFLLQLGQSRKGDRYQSAELPKLPSGPSSVFRVLP